jgi:hypothetical protein
MPVSVVLLFFAAPILYAAMNSLTVPSIDSMDTLRDEYTRKPTSTNSKAYLAQTMSAE